MSDAGFRYSETDATPADALAVVRATGEVSARFKRVGAATRLDALWETGGYRLKFPDVGDGSYEAIVVNTGGGVAGGDRVLLDLVARARTRVTGTTASAERVYRSNGPTADVTVRLEAERGATLAWLPHETILFSGARLVRRFDVSLAADARLVMAEMLVLGRTGSGEVLGDGTLRDNWRVRREGRLVLADTVRLAGNLGAMLARPAVTASASCVATLLIAAPEAEDRLEAARAALGDTGGRTAVSAWNGLLVMRSVGHAAAAIKDDLRRLLQAVHLCDLPRAWAG